jgi:cytochrome c
MRSVSYLLVVAGMLAAGGAGAQSPDELLKSKGCLGCHAMDTKKIGPAYKDVAAKYKGDKSAADKLVAALKSGQGHPVKSNASDADLKTMVRHVLSAK